MNGAHVQRQLRPRFAGRVHPARGSAGPMPLANESGMDQAVPIPLCSTACLGRGEPPGRARVMMKFVDLSEPRYG